jgi:Secretion system C-terminal sorting domain
MKKLYITFILFLFYVLVKAQPIVFADANFKARLLLAGTVSGSNVAFNGWNGYYANSPTAIDTNNDREIQPNEAAVITKLDLTYSNISNLSGIEYFTNLRELGMTDNPIYSFSNAGMSNLVNLIWGNNGASSSISINLNGFPNLKWASLINNSFNSITLNNMPLLETLYIGNNPLTTMDFSGLPSLKEVSCSATLVSTLDFMNNPQFERLYFGNNPNLTTIKIKNGAMQNFIHPQVSSLPLPCSSNFPNLNYICADANEITDMQNWLSNCGISQPITYNSSCVLGIDDFSFQNVSVYPNPATSSFTINADVAKVAIYSITGQLVKQFTGAFDSNYNYAINDLNTGIYLVRIMDNDSNEKSLRLIKQ